MLLTQEYTMSAGFLRVRVDQPFLTTKHEERELKRRAGPKLSIKPVKKTSKKPPNTTGIRHRSCLKQAKQK